MRGTVAKKIRATHQNTGAHTKAHEYFRGQNGMILADRDRRVYQMRKQKYYMTGVV
jgi:hypothetical protein